MDKDTAVCKYCGHAKMRYYVGFFPQEAITKAYNANNSLPKYGFHYGIECAECGKWQKWVKQTDEMLGIKFYKSPDEI